ncbi:hypothetical protein [Janthinobacterium violaceinigrum]|uniref:Uncharacterized protein n=1 Tax=Janthinobacterium violaceinigrum TaxID=2654252 RepID=A0A6I1I6T9_9BURK|nr:hypothetical protein [Janthinobacterium violaceinigrum]KAB8065740.1 hypothetical protein GCN75_05710 [Janthinobacterium violaceinigrum]
MRLILLSILFFSSPVFSKEVLPPDIKRFISHAQACEHLAGEFDGELPERQRDDIVKNIDKYCKAAKTELRILGMKYKGNARMMEVIQNNANDAVNSYQG